MADGERDVGDPSILVTWYLRLLSFAGFGFRIPTLTIMPTRQATPGASTGPVLLPSPSNARKRGASESEGVTDSSSRNSKKLKAETYKDKKKRRKKKRKLSIVSPTVPESSSKSRKAPDIAVASSSFQIPPSTYAGAVDPVEALDPSIVSICIPSVHTVSSFQEAYYRQSETH